MADHVRMTDHPASADQSPAGHSTPDYELPEALRIEGPEQYKALFDETRNAIIRMLSERAATVSELAEALDKPKGTVGHHMHVLADAGLVHVVRTQKVRALEAKYWGRTARVFYYDRVDAAIGHGQRLLERAAAEFGQLEAEAAAGVEVTYVHDANRRDVRIPDDRAREFHHRLQNLLMEFAEEPRAGQTSYALVFGIFPSAQPQLRDRPAGGESA